MITNYIGILKFKDGTEKRINLNLPYHFLNTNKGDSNYEFTLSRIGDEEIQITNSIKSVNKVCVYDESKRELSLAYQGRKIFNI